jgi:hypothetical protein
MHKAPDAIVAKKVLPSGDTFNPAKSPEPVPWDHPAAHQQSFAQEASGQVGSAGIKTKAAGLKRNLLDEVVRLQTDNKVNERVTALGRRRFIWETSTMPPRG